MNWALYRRELYSRQRKKRVFFLPMAWAALLSATFLIAILLIGLKFEERSLVMIERGMGRDLFIALAVLQMMIATLVVPAFTAGSLVSERTQGTLDLLALTLLRPSSVLIQKFTSALSSVLVFLSVAFPLVALCYALGGIGLGEIAHYYALLILTVLSLGSIGLCCSVLCRKNYMSYLWAYAIASYLSFGFFLFFILIMVIGDSLLGFQMDDELFIKIFGFGSPVFTICSFFEIEDLGDFPVGLYIPGHAAFIAVSWLIALITVRRRYPFR